MKITFIQIDKTDQVFIEQGIAEYTKRIKRYHSFEIVTLVISKSIRSRSIPEQKKEEEKQLLNLLLKYDSVYLLDENGREYSSQQFALHLQQVLNSAKKNIAFVIGGPYGFSEEIKKLYPLISFSRFTFSHSMIRLLFCEQLYRAFTIIKGEKYHHQ